MPYKMIKQYKKGKISYKVVNSQTGKVHAKSTTKTKAQAQLRLLRMIEHR